MFRNLARPRHGISIPTGILVFFALLVLPLPAEHARDGGPDSVDALLEDSSATHPNLLNQDLRVRWDEWKGGVAEATGLSFGIDYSTQMFAATDALAGEDDYAAGGMARFYGKWEILNRGETNSGTLNWKVEHRHRYTDVAPSGFASAIGDAGFMAGPFSNNNLRLTNLYWRQGLGERVVAYLGFLDVTDFVDVYALGSPWTGYSNLAFSTGAASMALPPDAGLGAMLDAWATDNVYLIGGITDLNADPTDPFNGFDSFFDESEFFTSLEFGWTTSKDRFYTDNVHLTLWHVDAVDATGTSEGWGANFSASKWIDDNYMPFLRAGYTDGAGGMSLFEASVSVGVAANLCANRDLVGIAANWGRANEDTYGVDDDQFTIEAFYRLQLTQAIRITPSVQLVFDPVNNPDDDFIAVFGLRGVASF